jgi:hypothetical protein
MRASFFRGFADDRTERTCATSADGYESEAERK